MFAALSQYTFHKTTHIQDTKLAEDPGYKLNTIQN